ncbi:NAD-dependent deacylase [Engelhardtia mirabilis]
MSHRTRDDLRVGGVVVLTGAGISAEAGLPTFRDAGGLWEGHRPEEVATPKAWAADPELVWRFYQARRARLGAVQPGPAHHSLVQLETRCQRAGLAFTLVTQNVDDLHQRAGSTVLAMHGQLRRLRCESCGNAVQDADSLEPNRFVPCAACGWHALRPDVVWFGEVPHGLDRIEQALLECGVFLSIGTSGAVYPAAGLLSVARAAGARTIVNSLESPENLHPADDFRPGLASEVVPALVDELTADLRLPR